MQEEVELGTGDGDLDGLLLETLDRRRVEHRASAQAKRDDVVRVVRGDMPDGENDNGGAGRELTSVAAGQLRINADVVLLVVVLVEVIGDRCPRTALVGNGCVGDVEAIIDPEVLETKAGDSRGVLDHGDVRVESIQQERTLRPAPEGLRHQGGSGIAMRRAPRRPLDIDD